MAGKTAKPKETKAQSRTKKTPVKARAARSTRSRAAAKTHSEEPLVLEQNQKPHAHEQGESDFSSTEESAEDGAERLREAVNHQVAQNAGKIAGKLAEQAAAGNTASAKILVQLIGDKKNKSPQRKKRSGPSEAQILEMETEWVNTTTQETEATAL